MCGKSLRTRDRRRRRGSCWEEDRVNQVAAVNGSTLEELIVSGGERLAGC